MAKAGLQFGNPEGVERPSLEVVTRKTGEEIREK
jgi:hypothetical protein